MQKSTIFWISLVLLLVHTSASIYQKYFDEAYSIASSMTIKQKIGQTIQADFYQITNKANGTDPRLAEKYFLGSLLVGGNGLPDEKGNMIQTPDNDQAKTVELYKTATIEKWQTLANKFDYDINVQTKTGKQYTIKPLLATDAVHNNQHVVGTILFPHNIGLSCSHNPQNFENLGKWTAINVKKSGFNYAFAPTVAVSHNPQWGRFYQTMGQESEYIYKYGYSYVKGVQQVKNDKIQGVLASVKHFIGDGATQYGADEGSATVGSYKSFIDHNIQGYIGSSQAQVGSAMCTYSAINYVPVSISPHMTALLRQKAGFDGFIISDYDEMNKIAAQNMPTDFLIMNTSQAFSMGTIAGIDMWMLPSWKPISQYIQSVEYALGNKTITEERITEAVARILSVKMAMGLVKSSNGIERENIKEASLQISAGQSQYQDALTAVHQSLVLLQNKNNVLPLTVDNLQYIVLVGQKIININNLAKNQLFTSYDNIGMQSGGWSVRWQGFQGNSMWQGNAKTQSNASSILDALKNLNKSFKLVYPNYTTYKQVQVIDRQRNQYLQQLKTLRQSMNSKNTIILGVLGQSPYAEFSGDVNIPYCKNQTVISDKGCLYDANSNPYLPDKQRTTLKVDYEKFDKQVISSIQQQDKAIPLVTVLLAGRPLLINDVLTQSNVVLDAFLPGTAGGQGIMNALTGSYAIRPNGQSNKVNSLSFDWPSSMDQIKIFPVYGADGKIPKIADPLFKVGFGLSTSAKQQITVNKI